MWGGQACKLWQWANAHSQGAASQCGGRRGTGQMGNGAGSHMVVNVVVTVCVHTHI